MHSSSQIQPLENKLLNRATNGREPPRGGSRPRLQAKFQQASAGQKYGIYDGGHGAFPRPEAVRETLEWLDKYLGPVSR